MPIGTEIVRNGKAYDSGDVDVTIDGVMFPGVAKIEYSVSQEHQKNFSLKNRGTSWSKGKINESGKLELYMEDAVALQLGAGKGKSLLDIKPFYTTSTFTNEDQVVITDRILWKFQDDGRVVDGSMGLKKEYEMFVLGIWFNV
jgi:hypothetical protein